MALLVLGALPIGAFCGAFRSVAVQEVRAPGMIVRVRHATRSAYRADELIEVALEAEAACARLTIGGLEPFLKRFEDVRMVPVPPSADRLFEGPIAAGTRLTVQVYARPFEVGPAHGLLRVGCDDRQVATLPLSTFVFP